MLRVTESHEQLNYCSSKFRRMAIASCAARGPDAERAGTRRPRPARLVDTAAEPARPPAGAAPDNITPHRASASRSTVGCPPLTSRIGRRRVDGSATTQTTRSQVMVGSWSSSRLPRGRDVGGEFAVSASKVLHEGVSGGDRLYGAVGALPIHGPYAVRELATIGHDRIVVHNAATGSRKAHRVAIIIGG